MTPTRHNDRTANMERIATTSPHHAKLAVKKIKFRLGRRLEWRDVLSVVQEDATRSAIVQSLAAGGFSVDDFATLKVARKLVCDALIDYEDRLEFLHGGKLRAAEREKVRAVRRRLELELWP